MDATAVLQLKKTVKNCEHKLLVGILSCILNKTDVFFHLIVQCMYLFHTWAEFRGCQYSI